MKNSWKGLVVGGCTGAAIGMVLDAAHRAGQKAIEVRDLAAEHAPEAVHWAKQVTDRAATALRDADVPDKVSGIAHRLADAAPSVGQARDAVGAAGKAVAHGAASAAGAVKGTASDVAKEVAKEVAAR